MERKVIWGVAVAAVALGSCVWLRLHSQTHLPRVDEVAVEVGHTVAPSPSVVAPPQIDCTGFEPRRLLGISADLLRRANQAFVEGGILVGNPAQGIEHLSVDALRVCGREFFYVCEINGGEITDIVPAGRAGDWNNIDGTKLCFSARDRSASSRNYIAYGSGRLPIWKGTSSTALGVSPRQAWQVNQQTRKFIEVSATDIRCFKLEGPEE